MSACTNDFFLFRSHSDIWEKYPIYLNGESCRGLAVKRLFLSNPQRPSDDDLHKYNIKLELIDTFHDLYLELYSDQITRNFQCLRYRYSETSFFFFNNKFISGLSNCIKPISSQRPTRLVTKSKGTFERRNLYDSVCSEEINVPVDNIPNTNFSYCFDSQPHKRLPADTATAGKRYRTDIQYHNSFNMAT